MVTSGASTLAAGVSGAGRSSATAGMANSSFRSTAKSPAKVLTVATGAVAVKSSCAGGRVTGGASIFVMTGAERRLTS